MDLDESKSDSINRKSHFSDDLDIINERRGDLSLSEDLESIWDKEGDFDKKLNNA